MPSFNVLIFFSSIWASSVLIPVLSQSCSNKLKFVYLTITSHLACWKSRKLPILEGKKDILKNFPKYKSIVYKKSLIWWDGSESHKLTAHHYWTLFLKSISWLLWYIFLFPEHNPSFPLFLTFSPNLSVDVLIKCVLVKKRVYLYSSSSKPVGDSIDICNSLSRVVSPSQFLKRVFISFILENKRSKQATLGGNINDNFSKCI